jgi:hypothetical protein
MKASPAESYVTRNFLTFFETEKYRVVIERNVTIVLDVGLLIGGEIATVTVDCHGLVCFPDIGRGLVAKRDQPLTRRITSRRSNGRKKRP